MNCPVCKIKIELELPSQEELYYDCSNCQSSLLFKGGECEVIHRGQWEEEKTDSEKTEEVQQEENLQSESEQVLETQGSMQGSEAEALETEMSEDNQSLNADESVREENKLRQEQEPAEELSSEENNLESEEGFEAVTEVPELEEGAEEKEPVKEEESSYPFEESSQALKDEGKASSHSEKPTEKGNEDFSDLADFAKRRDQETKGLYLYDLTLSEMNSQALKDEVLDVLENSLLNLSFKGEDSYLKDVMEKGEISLPNLSPVQVYVIVHSLMGLPLKIHWKQRHIADP